MYLQGYPWKKVKFWRNKTFFGPTFPFPWSPGLSSLAALGRQLSCRSRKVKSCPSESLVPPQFHSFIGNPIRIYILEPSSPCIQSFWTYSNRWAAVTSTFGAIKEALPIIFLFSKIRQTWGHSPSWVGRSWLGMKMPPIRSPFSLCSPHLIIGQCDSPATPLGMGVGKVSLVKSNSWYEFKLILS